VLSLHREGWPVDRWRKSWKITRTTCTAWQRSAAQGIPGWRSWATASATAGAGTVDRCMRSSRAQGPPAHLGRPDRGRSSATPACISRARPQLRGRQAQRGRASGVLCAKRSGTLRSDLISWLRTRGHNSTSSTRAAGKRGDERGKEAAGRCRVDQRTTASRRYGGVSCKWLPRKLRTTRASRVQSTSVMSRSRSFAWLKSRPTTTPPNFAHVGSRVSHATSDVGDMLDHRARGLGYSFFVVTTEGVCSLTVVLFLSGGHVGPRVNKLLRAAARMLLTRSVGNTR